MSKGKIWQIYLSGEIHTDWRRQIIDSCAERQLPVEFSSPQLNHDASDSCGDRILGEESQPFWRDHKASKINAIRNKTLIQEADIVIVRFGDKYRQWNAAFDAGMCVCLGKPFVVMHDESLTHALKEVDAAANAVTENPAQIVELLTYLTRE